MRNCDTFTAPLAAGVNGLSVAQYSITVPVRQSKCRARVDSGKVRASTLFSPNGTPPPFALSLSKGDPGHHAPFDPTHPVQPWRIGKRMTVETKPGRLTGGQGLGIITPPASAMRKGQVL